MSANCTWFFISLISSVGSLVVTSEADNEGVEHFPKG